MCHMDGNNKETFKLQPHLTHYASQLSSLSFCYTIWTNNMLQHQHNLKPNMLQHQHSHDHNMLQHLQNELQRK